MRKVRKGRVVIAVLILLIVIFNIFFATFMLKMRKVDNNNTNIEITVESGMSANSIISLLKENNLIRDEFMCKLYTKISNISMQAGIYEFSSSMSSFDILKSLNNGKVTSKYNINITFIEGKNINWYASTIEKYTNNTVDDVYTLLKDEEYIDSLIDEYWFLTDEIKNDEIYYPLEGYLFPETYTFSSKDVSVEEIFEVMLNQTDKILSKYKSDIENKNLSVHEFLTLASIVELEGVYDDDRSLIAGVFYNRLNDGWSLGSDVTTYYAVQKDMAEYPVIWQEWIEYDSPYNTRLSKMAGKLPVGPVGNPGEASIKASINPTDSDYYYFVADCKLNKTVFAKNDYEFGQKVREIKAKGCEF